MTDDEILLEAKRIQTERLEANTFRNDEDSKIKITVEEEQKDLFPCNTYKDLRSHIFSCLNSEELHLIKIDFRQYYDCFSPPSAYVRPVRLDYNKHNYIEFTLPRLEEPSFFHGLNNLPYLYWFDSKHDFGERLRIINFKQISSINLTAKCMSTTMTIWMNDMSTIYIYIDERTLMELRGPVLGGKNAQQRIDENISRAQQHSKNLKELNPNIRID